MFFGHGERAPLIRPSAGARQTPAKMSVCAGFQIRCGLKTIVQPPKCQHQKKPFDGKLFCNLAFFARLRTSRSVSASDIFHRGWPDSVLYGSALYGTVLESSHLVAGSGHRHVTRAPLPAASRSACAEYRASKIFVILRKAPDYKYVGESSVFFVIFSMFLVRKEL